MMKENYPDTVLEPLTKFLRAPLYPTLQAHANADALENAVQLYRHGASHVPAYRQFLTDQGIDPDAAISKNEFAHLPLTSKTNYMQKQPLPMRCRNGRISDCDRLAVSSGSTGAPTFWPRSITDEMDIAFRFEHVFRESFAADRLDTLAVVCFPLGNWVGGIFTTSCCWLLAQKGYPITVATPGNKPDEIFRIIRELGPHFEQTVLLGYPPFVKDIIDTGESLGIDWPSYRIKLVFAGEVFSEEWRSLILRKVGSNSPCLDSASLYGTADAGILGNETPLSIAIRRFLAAHPEFARELFGEARLPTLVQYDLISRYFELVDGATLAVSGNNGVPLIRYHIADRGGLIAHDELLSFLTKRGFASDDNDAALTTDIPLPFVWVFGRADFTVSFYGANIYPENVLAGLERVEFVNWISGKFVMEVLTDSNGSEHLAIVVELLPNANAGNVTKEAIARSIREQMLRLNSEFTNYVPENKQTPNVSLRSFGDPEFFPVGVKHRYTRKNSNL